MATYSNMTYVNIASGLDAPALSGGTATFTVTNVTAVNISGAAGVGAVTTSWTNTNANFMALGNIVANLVKIVKGLSL